MDTIETIQLFPDLNTALIKLLKTLKPDEWLVPSPISGRTVKDLASHLLDGTLRRLSMQRDGFSDVSKEIVINDYNELVGYIQELNRGWILATRRLSPAILIDLLQYSETRLYDFLKSLNPLGKAGFSVAWAGESESENWFDIAREFTEKWHHQMQIRLALGKPLLMDEKYTNPLYETFMLGLPFLFRDVISEVIGTALKINIPGKKDRTWFLVKKPDKWELLKDYSGEIKSGIEIPESIAWILFTNTDREKWKFNNKVLIKGDRFLGEKVLGLVTVMS